MLRPWEARILRRSADAGRDRHTARPGAGAPPRARREPRAALMLGHGAGGGIKARDLQAVTRSRASSAYIVALVEQPYLVAGRRSPAPAHQLDAAWLAVVEHLRARELAGLPLVAGGRSSGARVACRTAAAAGAVAVLCLAFPVHPPGKPEKSRLDELDGVDVPVLVIQGEADPFGMPPERPAARSPSCRARTVSRRRPRRAHRGRARLAGETPRHGAAPRVTDPRRTGGRRRADCRDAPRGASDQPTARDRRPALGRRPHQATGPRLTSPLCPPAARGELVGVAPEVAVVTAAGAGAAGCGPRRALIWST